eukprot:2291870-Rhodomonas_salina.2
MERAILRCVIRSPARVHARFGIRRGGRAHVPVGSQVGCRRVVLPVGLRGDDRALREMRRMTPVSLARASRCPLLSFCLSPLQSGSHTIEHAD